MTGASLVAVTSVLTACAPTLTRRHAVVTPSSGAGQLSVTATAMAIEPSAPRTFFEMSPEGQAAMVSALAEKVTSAADLQAALAAPIRGAAGSGVQDLSTQSRRIVLSIDVEHKGLADRLATCRTELSLPATSPGRFKTWNQLSTRYETIDLGKISATQKGTLSFGLESLAPGSSEISKATLGGTAERSMAEEVLLRQRYAASTGTLVPLKATILQQGAVGLDLVGNMVFDVTLAADKTELFQSYRPDGLFTAEGKPQTSDKVRLTRRIVRAPVSADADVTATVTTTCAARTVTAGVDTFTESDDEVAYEPRTGTSQVTIVAKEDLRLSKWFLQNKRGEVLAIAEPDGSTSIAFDSYDGARDFLLWLLASDATDVAGRPIGLGGVGSLIVPPRTPRWRDLSVQVAGMNWALPAPSPMLVPTRTR